MDGVVSCFDSDFFFNLWGIDLFKPKVSHLYTDDNSVSRGTTMHFETYDVLKN